MNPRPFDHEPFLLTTRPRPIVVKKLRGHIGDLMVRVQISAVLSDVGDANKDFQLLVL